MANPASRKVTPGSNNIFADLDLPDAAELQTKARLAAAICSIVGQKHLSQSEVASILDISQPKVSALLRYKLEGYSVERLMRFLVALDHDVEIVVRPRPRSRSARIAVKAA